MAEADLAQTLHYLAVVAQQHNVVLNNANANTVAIQEIVQQLGQQQAHDQLNTWFLYGLYIFFFF